MHDRLVSRRIDALHQCFLVICCSAVLHFLSFGNNVPIPGFLENIHVGHAMMRPNWPKLASLV